MEDITNKIHAVGEGIKSAVENIPIPSQETCTEAMYSVGGGIKSGLGMIPIPSQETCTEAMYSVGGGIKSGLGMIPIPSQETFTDTMYSVGGGIKCRADGVWENLPSKSTVCLVGGGIAVLYILGPRRVFVGILNALGFTAKGIAKGSFAALCHAYYGLIRVGSWFASAQSMGATEPSVAITKVVICLLLLLLGYYYFKSK